MRRIIKKPLAKSDLKEIWQYIAANNPAKADQYLDAIETALQKLSEAPLLDRMRADLAPQLYSFIIKRHVIFYRPLGQGSIEVIRILHGARDLKKLLKEAGEA
jgi:toxin ParE1/3/4